MNSKLFLEKKWAFVLIFFILFFNPVFYFWADNINTKDKCMACVICLMLGLALSGIDLFLKKRGEKIYLSILFLLSIAPNLIVWSYLFISNIYMKGDMFWVIFNTNASESEEYFDQFISWQIILISAVYILSGIFFIVKTRSKHYISIKKYWALFTFFVSFVVLSIVSQNFVQAVSAFDFYNSWVGFWNENRKYEQGKELRNSLLTDVECALPDSTNRVFVVLIGESMSACHISLYGYFRETTPVMDSLSQELDVYTDVVTPDTHTINVMKKVLSFADSSHPEYYTQKPSMIEMFNAAGFETYWISNHEFISKWGGNYGAIAQEAKHIYNLNPFKKPDEILLPYLYEALHDGITGNKIIFVHLMGSHHIYKCRYPENFEYFNYKERGDLDNDFRDDDMKRTIDEYDNSIRYTDFVFGSAFKQVKDLNISSCLLFFSDHGEEVYDTRNKSGHFMANVYPCQCKIPFILWRSEKYKEEMPELVIDTFRPYSIEDIIYSLSTLTNLKYKANEPEKSIFSPEYKIPEKRLVGEENYDDILRKL